MAEDISSGIQHRPLASAGNARVAHAIGRLTRCRELPPRTNSCKRSTSPHDKGRPAMFQERVKHVERGPTAEPRHGFGAFQKRS
jgi:hypothetical protein